MKNNDIQNKIGIDRCRFELIFKQQQKDFTRVIKVVNRYGFEFGEITTERGKWIMSLCLPKYFNTHNAVPVKMDKQKYFDEIIECIYDSIRSNFMGPFKTSLSTIELNITEVYKNCNYESFFLLLNHSMLDEIRQNARYEISDRKIQLRPLTTGIKTRVIKGRFFVKAYDKKRQLFAEYGTTIEYSPIRIEIVFSKVALKQYFGESRKIDIIFSKIGLEKLIYAYMNTMNEVLINYVDPYLNEIHNEMLKYMRKKGNNIRDTYCEYKEVVYDIEQLRKVLKDYYKENNKIDNSRKVISDLNKKFSIPNGMLNTLEKIKKSINVNM